MAGITRLEERDFLHVVATQRGESAISRRDAPEVVEKTSAQKIRGRGNAGCPVHPQPVCIGRKHTVVTTGTAGTPGIPRAMVLTVSFVLSPATNSFLSPSLSGLTVQRTRLGSQNLRQLDTSNGCQDHTTSPYAATSPRLRRAMCCRRSFGEGVEAPFVCARLDRSQGNPPCDSIARPTLPRPPHPIPRS